ncbi:MAG: transglutaminase domain-containing protein [Chitinophagaceae bacterium]|nr:transglutaminase domain-containing protein [Chitinophagaceae bacterium]
MNKNKISSFSWPGAVPFGTAIIISVFLLTACNTVKTYDKSETSAVEYRPNTAFASFEDISLPRFDSLKIKYQLDTVFHGETDEFKRILLLRNWIRNHIAINDFGDPYPGGGHPAGIIDAAAKGQGFHCGHYMIVQNAVMNAYGYVTRCLGSGPGVKGGEDGHHGMNEIWVNEFGKWVLSDAKFNHHFEKNGIPLSALEVREEFLKNKAADIVLVKGPDRTPIQIDSLKDQKGKYVRRNKEWFAQWYTWIEWDQQANRFSAWPSFDTKLNMFRDDYFKNHTWIWDGKPHWGYNTDAINYQDSRAAIEWTPNTIEASVIMGEKDAEVRLSSITPNFKEYQMRAPESGEWIKCDSIVKVKFDKDALKYSFRAVNLQNVAGPEYQVEFDAAHI